MTSQQDLDIDAIMTHLSNMRGKVENAFVMASEALFGSHLDLAQRIIENDKAINSFEIDIDNMTFTYLAMRKPQGRDLRRILSIQKTTAILERIGDHIVNIAESAISLGSLLAEANVFNLSDMSKSVQEMLRDSFRGFFADAMTLAHQVLTRDDEIDHLNISLHAMVKEQVMSGKMSFETGTELIRVSKNFERIADLATNIAEEAIFSAQGTVVKHHVSRDAPVAAVPWKPEAAPEMVRN